MVRMEENHLWYRVPPEFEAEKVLLGEIADDKMVQGYITLT